MAGSVTVKDLAQAASVSVGTVSRVLNNHSNVTDEIRRRVMKAASEMGYPMPGEQQGIMRNSSRTLKDIGFIYLSYYQESALGNPFWSQILTGVEKEARKASIKVAYQTVDAVNQSPQQISNIISGLRLGGILLVGPTETDLVKLLQVEKLPVVLVNHYIPKLSVSAVLCNNFEGAYEAVNYLIQQSHQQIAFISGPTASNEKQAAKYYPVQQRALAYRTALIDANLKADYNLFEASDLSITGGYDACKRLLERKAKFTAIFCANDSSAIGVMKALKEAGLRVPKDVSVIGFDDIDVAKHLTPPLTTVSGNMRGVGVAAVKSLLTLTADPTAEGILSIVPVELIKRDSVAIAKN